MSNRPANPVRNSVGYRIASNTHNVAESKQIFGLKLFQTFNQSTV